LVLRVAACQLNSRADRAVNLAAARSAVQAAAAAGADLAVLPEFVDYLGPSTGAPNPESSAGEFCSFFAATASELGIWVLAGSFREAAGDGRAYNTSPLFDRSGRLVAAYRKIHLYDVEIPGRVSYRESATIAPGPLEPVVADVEGLRLGLSICYDLRFGELYRSLVTAGAQVLLVPAAFMLHTGRDHWEVLLRARAIEEQCYVVAAGQIGDHDASSGQSRTCFGRSMVIDPWGTVVAQAPDVIGLTVADLDPDRIATVRRDLPALAHRRL
jgi:predicted amidohydrolase